MGLPHQPCAPAAEPGCWGGIYPLVMTPYCENGVDILSLERQIRHELSGGVQGLMVLGTFGEGQYVTPAERVQVISTAVRVAGGSVPVVAGIHSGDLADARAQLVQAHHLGASAVLVKYTGHPKASGQEVLGFIAALAEMNLLPIFYYHYPSQTGLYLKPEEVAAILSLPGVVGVKESTLDLREVQAHVRLTCHQGKVVMSSTALNLTQVLDLGGHGAMCPEAVLLPGPTVQAYRAFREGRHDEARCLQEEFFTLLPILRDRAAPVSISRVAFMAAQDHKVPLPLGHNHPEARLKAALDCLGITTSPQVKPPLPPLTEKDHRRVERAMKDVKAIDWAAVPLQVPPAPLSNSAVKEEGGMLLKTGAFLLGPGVGRDLLRSQSDGEWSF
jgi:4-hydroxy-tetrahydrodipicolinate synthase